MVDMGPCPTLPGDLKISRSPGQSARPSVLVIEPDCTTARRMVVALGRRSCLGQPQRRAADRRTPEGRGSSPAVIGSLRELFEQNLSGVELVICSVSLPDGTGLNALDYLRGQAPQVPVILLGAPQDASLAVEAIGAGAVDFLTSTGHDLQALGLAVEKCLAQQRVKHENQRLQRDLSDSLAELAVKNQQLQALVRQLETTVRTDDLTGLCNRRSLNEMLHRLWQQSARGEGTLAIMMIDLDDFKIVNDRLGHLRGDQVLRQAGRMIQANCRQVDMAARFGGDEFCVLMPECESHEAVAVALRLLREWERASARRPPGEPHMGISVGVAQARLSRPADPEELIRHADEALYAAKAAGKGRVMVRGDEGVRPVQEPPIVDVDSAIGVSW
jgi:diguanylate cyclase (GGDEF)-like protein